ncbi:hypothetical protein [Kribbella sindirgiensis]|uniref:YokE-like PH domain-containing protein n=1 Tax=Kribbella sindirgiensis TaxID=1124744 RepID=A0A4R0I548_9ACTN|nr:hypothetical protein [Kribbella sindirgiensis]TCC21654.1 hypothetical protein E0H50_35860 [Kribbella sindirgiensis]
MANTDRFSRKARKRLEAQLGPDEQVLHSATVGPVGLVLTNRRLMLAPYVRGVDDEVNPQLSAIHNVAWRKGSLWSPGVLTIYTGSQTLTYDKVPNKQGESAAIAIRQAMAAQG